MNLKLTVAGLDESVEATARIERGAARMGATEAIVFSRAPHAYGQEYGSHRRSGKTARRAGGAAYLRRAIDAVMSDAERDVAEGMEKVRAPGPWVLKRLAYWTRRRARLLAPRSARLRRKKDGKARKRLRNTIHADVRKR